MNINKEKLKKEILELCGVVPTEQFDVKSAVRSRIDYLKSYLMKTGTKGFVLGISGGVDSTATGKLCQLACEELRNEGYEAYFIAARLPAGVQKDEDEAMLAIDFIKPDVLNVINVGPASQAISIQGVDEYNRTNVKGLPLTPAGIDFNKGNIKARMRMLAQYQLAAFYGALVIGTDHNSEFCTGFFTKGGDGQCDITVLNGLNKRQVRLVAKELGAPEKLYKKAPTADLEELNPQKLDDEGFGFEYDKLDDFLEGKEVDAETELKIMKQYEITRHKRDPIVGFKG
jgi:NAD+ synthase